MSCGNEAIRNSALLTDLYQLTMAQGFWQTGSGKTQAIFEVFFRENPFDGGYTIACGTGLIPDVVEAMKFSEADIEYLATLTAPGGGALFQPEFLDFLSEFEPHLDIEAVAEGEIVFPREPIVRVTGPIIDCQMIETMLLNLVNFQTLVATKSSRVCLAAGKGDIRRSAVAEFGLRRAQGPNGGVAASRGAFIGGCVSTSNVLAGKMYGIPVSGTHAHSWVMSFPTELEAFRAYASAAPANCTLLVDTYNVEEGVKNAIIVGHEMEERGERLRAIRIDSGDLAVLSKMARTMFDAAGLEYVKISVSNDLDEYTISSLLAQDAPIDAWGVGTKLATCYDQPALAGVYKLSSVRYEGAQEWTPVMKISEQAYKRTVPGNQHVTRYYDEDGMPIGDMIWDPAYRNEGDPVIVDVMDDALRRNLGRGASSRDLFIKIVTNGQVVASAADVNTARERCINSLEKFGAGIKRTLNPQVYPVGIESGLSELRSQMIYEGSPITSEGSWK